MKTKVFGIVGRVNILFVMIVLINKQKIFSHIFTHIANINLGFGVWMKSEWFMFEELRTMVS